MILEDTKKKTSPTRTLSGFMLIELLIAIAIGALVLTSAYASFSFGIKTRHRLAATSREMRETRYFLDQFSKEIRSSVSFHPSSFSGGNRNIRFRGFLPRELAALGNTRLTGGLSHQLEHLSTILEIEYSVSEKDESVHVVRTVSNLRGEEVERTTFDLGITELTFSYGTQGGEGSIWEDGWGGRKNFPVLVKLEFDSGDTTNAYETLSRQKIVVLPTRLTTEKQES